MALSRALKDVIRKENGMVSKGKPGGDMKKPPAAPVKKST